jgi:hypothetical protein
MRLRSSSWAVIARCNARDGLFECAQAEVGLFEAARLLLQGLKQLCAFDFKLGLPRDLMHQLDNQGRATLTARQGGSEDLHHVVRPGCIWVVVSDACR